jgi:hypothetical protein
MWFHFIFIVNWIYFLYFLLSYVLYSIFKVLWNFKWFIDKLLWDFASILSSFHLQVHNSFNSRKFLTSGPLRYKSKLWMIQAYRGFPYIVMLFLNHYPFISGYLAAKSWFLIFIFAYHWIQFLKMTVSVLIFKTKSLGKLKLLEFLLFLHWAVILVELLLCFQSFKHVILVSFRA